MRNRSRLLDPGPLRDGDLELAMLDRSTDGPYPGWGPTYTFEMRSVPGGTRMGEVRFRTGDADTVLRYPCHVGYEVDESYRGHRYAARSIRLLVPFARAHGLTALWIGCEPDNPASGRTCELAGARLAETIDVPRDHPMYVAGIHRACRYFIDL